MSSRARRAGALLLALLLLPATPTRMVAAAAGSGTPATPKSKATGSTSAAPSKAGATSKGTTPAPKSTASKSTASKSTASKSPTAKKRTTARRKSARRPPPGGVYARHAIAVDAETGEVLFEKDAQRSVPIASLTKLMTALVFLDQKPDLRRDVMVSLAEVQGAGHTQLRVGEFVSLVDLLHMSLMSSDNCATRVLARESGLTRDDFLATMNRRALELGLTHTRYVEFTGLDARNVSTATDMARLLKVAAEHPMIHEITTTRSYEFRSNRRAHVSYNTNRLLYGQYEILGGKTGYISSAGYCLATRVRTPQRDLIAVVLGAPTNATRFADVVRLVQRTTTASLAARAD